VIYTIVENVRSLHNVGAIFRTADGAGIAKLYLTGITGKPPDRQIHKVALGAENHVPWEYHKDGIALANQLKQQKIQLIVLEEAENSRPYSEAEFKFPLCLVVGHEYDGVSKEMLALADQVIHIPMSGSKISLNVSVAYGIAVYEIVKSYKKKQ
jgi:tRNA G18 (ribose-2'-O)-methylase SpoU